MFPFDCLHWSLRILALVGALIPAWPAAATSDRSPATTICPPSEGAQRAFADLFTKAARRAGQLDAYVYDEREFRLQLRQPSGENLYAYLRNAYVDYCKATEEDRTSVIDGYVRSLLTTQSASEPASRQSLLPSIRGRALHEFADLMLAIDGTGAPAGRYHRTLGSDIAVGVASDGANQISLLTDATIADLGLDYDEALQIATDNLRRMSSDNWIEVGPSLFQSGWNDYYDPSRLLLADVIKRLPIRGDPVALAVDYNTSLVTGSKNKQGLLEMASLGRRMLEETTRPLSGQAITLVDGAWIDFVTDDAELRPLLDLQREQLNRYYEQQKSLLERLNEIRREDVFVATYMLMRKKDADKLTSYAVWSKGVPTLLPRADRVVFTDLDTATQFDVAWSTAERIVGNRMKKTDMYPELSRR